MTATGAGGVLAENVRLADRFGSRFLGLMGRRSLAPGEGLLLKNCSSIHCFFMRFPIDAVYLDAQLRVVGAETVAPWRVGHLFRGARHVLELAAGAAAGLRPGDTVRLSGPV
jgi:uncharacterized membrane protein (UPF0127 family)